MRLTRRQQGVCDKPTRTTSGDKDYLLKVIVSSIEEYEHLLKSKLTHLPLVDHLSSTFALKQVKNTTELPIKNQ